MTTLESVRALCRAVLARSTDEVRALLDADPSLIGTTAPAAELPDALRCGGNTALHLAAFVGSEELEVLLCERGIDPAARNEEGRTALHVALELNNTTRERLLALGCPLDVCAAACLGRHAELEALLDATPALANDDSTQLSPLGWATYFGAGDSMRTLVAHGARIDDGELSCAAGIASVEMGQLLVELGADVNAANEHGITALHVAAFHQYSTDTEPFVRWLLESGADASARTRRDKTALDIARERAREQAERGTSPGDPEHRNFAGVIALLQPRRAD